MTRKLGIAAAAVVAVAVVFFVSNRQPIQTTATPKAHVRADVLDGTIEKAIRDAGVSISDLAVHNAGGVVILRGMADSTASAQRAVEIVKSLGVPRVANLIATPAVIDDEVIRRAAERELASTSALDGCTLRVGCQKGIVTVTGTVQYDLQRDAARTALKRVPGVRDVKVDLTM